MTDGDLDLDHRLCRRNAQVALVARHCHLVVVNAVALRAPPPDHHQHHQQHRRRRLPMTPIVVVRRTLPHVHARPVPIQQAEVTATQQHPTNRLDRLRCHHLVPMTNHNRLMVAFNNNNRDVVITPIKDTPMTTDNHREQQVKDALTVHHIVTTNTRVRIRARTRGIIAEIITKVTIMPTTNANDNNISDIAAVVDVVPIVNIIDSLHQVVVVALVQ